MKSQKTNLTLTSLFAAFVVLQSTGCSSAPTAPANAPSIKGEYRQRQVKTLDKVKLAKDLGMYRKKMNTGFEQRAFNDCSLPRRYRKTQECSTQYLAVVNFRMRCRNSRGTVNEQVSNYELTPLKSRSIKWHIGKLEGQTQTDPLGYGQVIVRSHFPMKKKQFRLFANGHVMGVSAEEVRQFVLPKYWCE